MAFYVWASLCARCEVFFWMLFKAESLFSASLTVSEWRCVGVSEIGVYNNDWFYSGMRMRQKYVIGHSMTIEIRKVGDFFFAEKKFLGERLN